MGVNSKEIAIRIGCSYNTPHLGVLEIHTECSRRMQRKNLGRCSASTFKNYTNGK